MRKKVSVAVVLAVVVLAAVFALRQTADASDNAAEQSEVINDTFVPAEKIPEDGSGSVEQHIYRANEQEGNVPDDAVQSEVTEDKDSYVPAEKISDDADTVDHKFTPNIP